MPSQSVLQQYGSFAHTSPAQVLQVDFSAEPWVQTGWAHVPPPPLLLPLELPLLLPLELPLELLLELPLLLPLPLLEPLLLPLELPLELPLLLPLELPLELPLLLLDPPDPVSALPFGVPHPVGPSNPAPAVHRYDGLQLPLLPEVTS